MDGRVATVRLMASSVPPPRLRPEGRARDALLRTIDAPLDDGRAGRGAR